MATLAQFENPFVRKWGDEYKPEELCGLFSELIIPLIPRFFDFPNVFLYGGSGTGKTMLLRYLSFDVQKSYFKKERGDIYDVNRFLEYSSERINRILGRQKKYLGVYTRLTEIPSALFRNKCSTEQQEQALFLFYLDLVISIRFIASIADLIKDYKNETNKRRIESAILACVKQYSDIGESAGFADILEYLNDKKKQIDVYLSSLRLSQPGYRSTQIEETKIGGLARLFLNIGEVLKGQISEFSDVSIYIILDEYERIEEGLKVVINSIVRERNKFVELKTSLRRYGFTTIRTLNPNDFMLIGRDAELVDLEFIFRYNKGKYKKLLTDVAEKRLESVQFFRNNNLTDIKKLLKSRTPEEEANNIIRGKKRLEHRARFRNFISRYDAANQDQIINNVKYDENVLLEKLNMLLTKRRVAYQKRGVKAKKLYSDAEIYEMAREFTNNPREKSPYYYLYEKNRLALLFQLINEYRTRKTYAGFDMFAALSGGFVAWFLDLCYESLEIARDGGFSNGLLQIEADQQTKAAEKVAWGFLDNVIKNLERVGGDIYYFVLNAGALLRALYLDELIREPEPTYFNTKVARLKKSSREILTACHSWSVLQAKIPMMPKGPEQPLPDVHILHPILAPAFQISYRTRGRTDLGPEDMEILISGTEQDVNGLILKYRDKSLTKGITKRKPSNQMELFDL